MQKILLLSFFICLFCSVDAQVTFTIEPMMATGSANLDVLATSPKDVNAHATVTNNSGEMKTFTWELTTEYKPEIWAEAICDINGCYFAGVITESFQLENGQSSILDLHVYPSGDLTTLDGAVTGDGRYFVKVTDNSDPSNTLTAQYDVKVVDNNTVNSLTAIEVSQLNLFPNPASDVFELQGPEGVKTLKLYNLLGNELANYNASRGSFDISQFPRGMYLVALMDEKNHLVKTMRLQKR